MFNARKWFKVDVILLCVALAMVLVAVVPLAAHAQAFRQLGLVHRVVLGATVVKDTISGVADARASEMPGGYLIWSASGDEFWVRRNTSTLATFETHSLNIPADEEAIITPLQAVRSGTQYKHVLELKGTSGDTLLVGELYR